MELLYYQDPAGNFGDDLNAVMWRKLLPPAIFKCDDVALMGIGSIFNASGASLKGAEGKRVFVLGSGAGYGPLPAAWETWSVLAVRGPLTAELIGRPGVAATDGAALLTQLPEMISIAPRPDQTLLIPHYRSVERGQWERVAAELGFLFVDPRWSVEKVLAHMSRAKLVITEAMHGAIVADTMRIPWIPILIAPDALPFKWRDWTLSLNLDYKPTHVPVSSAFEAMYSWHSERETRRSGIVASVRTQHLDEPAALIADFRQRYAQTDKQPAASNKRKRGHLQRQLQSGAALTDGFFIRRAVKALRHVAQQEQFLSAEPILQRRVGELVGAVEKFVQMANAG